MKNDKHLRSLSQQRARAGRVFCTPFLIGFLLFFLVPVLQSALISFNTISAVAGKGFAMNFVGLSNYEKLFVKDPEYIPKLVQSFQSLAINFPCIILFSFFIAVVLNQKFRGRGFARAIFFLPVIITSGVIVLTQNNQIQQVTVSSISQQADSNTGGVMQLTDAVMGLINTIQVGPQLVTFIKEAVARIYDITTSSGIQILIFLAGLQTIPDSLYEASKVEGATGWETFWKITFR